MARKTVGYVRVSTGAQDLAAQKLAIQRAATARGDRIAAWYGEKTSAKVLERAALERLRSDVRAGLVGRVYAFKLDRLVRSGIDHAYRLVSEFRAAGTELIAIADGLHVKAGQDDLASECLVFALALCSKLERSNLLERQAAARAAMRAAGRSWGRPPRTTPQERKRIVEMWQSSCSFRSISMTLHLPKTTVHRVVAAFRKSPSVSASPIP